MLLKWRPALSSCLLWSSFCPSFCLSLANKCLRCALWHLSSTPSSKGCKTSCEENSSWSSSSIHLLVELEACSWKQFPQWAAAHVGLKADPRQNLICQFHHFFLWWFSLCFILLAAVNSGSSYSVCDINKCLCGEIPTPCCSWCL